MTMPRLTPGIVIARDGARSEHTIT